MEKDDKRLKYKQNMKIYSLYRMISLDIIFYYAIEFLFLTQVKNISAADVVLKSSFYALFMILLQIPATITINKLGTRTCTILGNLFNSISLLILIFATNLNMLIFGEFVSALCFSLKDISDTTLLNQSIPSSTRKSEIFSKLEGIGSKNYYYINAVTSIIAGFLYVINPYIPVIFAFLIALMATIMSFAFQDVEEKDNKEKISIFSYVRDVRDGFKFVIGSNRLRSLLLYSGIIWGVFTLISTYKTSLLENIGTSEQLIAIITAIVGIASGVGSKYQLNFHRRFRNKSLSRIMQITTIMILIMGLVGITKLSPAIIILVILITNIVINFMKGINGVLSVRYMGNFTNDQIITKIYAVNAISRNVFRMGIGFLGSYLLTITNTANATIIIGIFLAVISISLISYMSTRLGLKPEKYDKSDIYN